MLIIKYKNTHIIGIHNTSSYMYIHIYKNQVVIWNGITHDVPIIENVHNQVLFVKYNTCIQNWYNWSFRSPKLEQV